MIPIVPYFPPKQKGQKPNIFALIVIVLTLFYLTLSIFGFIFLNGMSFNIVLAILGIIILIASFIPIVVALESRQTNFSNENPIRYVSRPYSHVEPTWDNYPQTKHEYCVNCGSLVDPSDFFCAICGSRLK